MALGTVSAAENSLDEYKDIQYLKDIVDFLQRHEEERATVLIQQSDVGKPSPSQLEPTSVEEESKQIVEIGVSPFELVEELLAEGVVEGAQQENEEHARTPEAVEMTLYQELEEKRPEIKHENEELQFSAVPPSETVTPGTSTASIITPISYDTSTAGIEKQNIHVDAGVHFNLKKGEEDCEESESEDDCDDGKKKKFWFLPFSVDKDHHKVDPSLLVGRASQNTHNLFKSEKAQPQDFLARASVGFNKTTNRNKSNESFAYTKTAKGGERTHHHFVYEEDSSGSKLQVAVLSMVLGLAIVLNL